MLAAGTALVALGLWTLRGARAAAQAELERIKARRQGGSPADGTAPGPGSTPQSPATMGSVCRSALGLICLFGGYHLVAWALPPDWLGLKIPVSSWKALSAALVGLALLALAIDRLDRRGPSGPGGPA